MIFFVPKKLVKKLLNFDNFIARLEKAEQEIRCMQGYHSMPDVSIFSDGELRSKTQKCKFCNYEVEIKL